MSWRLVSQRCIECSEKRPVVQSTLPSHWQLSSGRSSRSRSTASTKTHSGPTSMRSASLWGRSPELCWLVHASTSWTIPLMPCKTMKRRSQQMIILLNRSLARLRWAPLHNFQPTSLRTKASNSRSKDRSQLRIMTRLQASIKAKAVRGTLCHKTKDKTNNKTASQFTSDRICSGHSSWMATNLRSKDNNTCQIATSIQMNEP